MPLITKRMDGKKFIGPFAVTSIIGRTTFLSGIFALTYAIYASGSGYNYHQALMMAFQYVTGLIIGMTFKKP